jgi:hypothetical protein
MIKQTAEAECCFRGSLFLAILSTVISVLGRRQIFSLRKMVLS